MGRKPKSLAGSTSVSRRQYNTKIDDEVANRLDQYCEKHDLMRDRTLERAIRLFLDAKEPANTHTFLVELSDDTAASLFAYRELFLVDRNMLVDRTLARHIESDIDREPEKRRRFLELKTAALHTDAN